MQILQNPTQLFFSFPKTLYPTSRHHPHHHHHSFFLKPPKAFSSDEFPVDETFLEKFAPKDKETEDEARKKNWIDRGWAPWEEILTPEADFARKSLNEGEEVPLQTPEAIEAFKMLSPKYRLQKIKEMGLTEDEWYRKQFEMKNVPEKLETVWNGGLVLTHVAPRDWPPRGWEVDRNELEYIREGHKMLGRRAALEDLEGGSLTIKENEVMCWDRYKVFLKQYNEWVTANKDRLEEESYEQDQDYYPGRRKRGKDYKEDMYELPFYYPGQICEGKVTTLHLYQGAFVDIGGVYDGWVPIKGNDWYWIRHHIKVGMHCIVEIVAKRDPYWFRFPIELRFVFPNVDHLIFNRFEYPPIFHREGINQDELRRYCGRPPVPRREIQVKPEEESLLSNHPYVDKLWEIHMAEQMILDDWETNPEKYKGKKLSELTDDEDLDEENNVQYCKVKYKQSVVDQVIIKQSVKELDLEAALAERKHHIKLRKEAEERGEKYKISHLRRNIEMDEYDLLHWRRSFEEREALIRDISCRQALGLPLEEPGRYKPASLLNKGQYDPENPLYRYDYWGEPKNSEKSKQQRMTDIHNKSIVGKGTVWYEMSYEDAIKQKMQREARMEREGQKEAEDSDEDDNENTEDDDDLDFDYSIFGSNEDGEDDDHSNQPLVNGTESPGLSDEGMFES